MPDWLTAIQQLKKKGSPAALVTISEVAGSAPREVGTKMVVSATEFWGTIGGGNLEKLVLEDARKALLLHEPQKRRYPLGAKAGQCCGGLVEVFIEVFPVLPKLFLFGAGHVGQAICQTLEGTAFEVHLVDERREWILHEAIPPSVVRHACDWEDFLAEAEWDAKRTYVAIMTHEHLRDEAILREVLRKPSRYLGLIGSEAKWRRFEARLKSRGFSEEELSRVKCPIGIGRFGKSPREVAISFSAQLLQQYYA